MFVMGKMSMSRLAGLALTACMCASLVLGGCATNTTREQKISRAIMSADASVSSGDLSAAYQALVPILNAPMREDSEQAQKYIQSRPGMLEAAEVSLLRNAEMLAKDAAKEGASESLYLSWLYNDLMAFKTVAHTRYASVLVKVKEQYRKYGPLDLPVGTLKTGMSRSDVLKVIERPPQSETVIRPLGESSDDLVVMEYITSLPATEGSLPVAAGKKNVSPIWLAFYKGELVSSGTGGTKEAEYSIYEDIMFSLARAKKITYSEGARALAAKHRELFGKPNDIAQEYWAYQAVLAEKIDLGKLTETETQYMMTQKVNELRKRVADAESELAKRDFEQQRYQAELSRNAVAANQGEEALRQQQMNQSLLWMGLGLQMMQQRPPTYQPSWPINCTTSRSGNFLKTTCH